MPAINTSLKTVLNSKQLAKTESLLQFTYMNNTLEGHKLFPYIAWTLVIGFALFTYSLTMRFQADLEEIATGINRIELKLIELENEPAPQPVR